MELGIAIVELPGPGRRFIRVKRAVLFVKLEKISGFEMGDHETPPIETVWLHPAITKVNKDSGSQATPTKQSSKDHLPAIHVPDPELPKLQEPEGGAAFWGELRGSVEERRTFCVTLGLLLTYKGVFIGVQLAGRHHWRKGALEFFRRSRPGPTRTTCILPLCWSGSQLPLLDFAGA